MKKRDTLNKDNPALLPGLTLAAGKVCKEPYEGGRHGLIACQRLTSRLAKEYMEGADCAATKAALRPRGFSSVSSRKRAALNGGGKGEAK
jgi:hypothetical protein